MESNKKGIRLKHKENFVEGIVNFFKRDKTPQKVEEQEDNSHSPRSVSPMGNRRKIFKNPTNQNSFQNHGVNLQNNYEITFNQNQRNKNFNMLSHQNTPGLSPLRKIHHQQSKVAGLILQSSNIQNPYRQTSMTSYKNPLQRPIYPSNQSIISINPQQHQSQKVRQMTKQLQSKNRQIYQLRQQVFNLKEHKQLSQMEIKSLKQQVHKLQRLNKILQDNQVRSQNYLHQKQKQTEKKISNFYEQTSIKNQRNLFQLKDSLPILPEVASEFRSNQRSKISDIQMEQNSMRNINKKGYDQSKFSQNRSNHELQNEQQIVSPFMAISTYDKTVKPKHQQKPESKFKKQTRFVQDQGHISKTIGIFPNLQPIQQVKGQNIKRKQAENNYQSERYSQSLLSYSQSSKKSKNSNQNLNQKSKQMMKSKLSEKSLRINDSKMFNFQDFDGGQQFDQAGFF